MSDLTDEEILRALRQGHDDYNRTPHIGWSSRAEVLAGLRAVITAAQERENA